MIEETYRSPTYPPDGPPICGRYVRQEPDCSFSWCETSTRGKNGWKWDVRRGTCDTLDLSPEVRRAAIAQRERGSYPFYVEWPLP